VTVDLFTEPILKDIAKKYGKTIAQIVLNFLLSRGVSVIPKSTKKDRIEENFDIQGFSLTEEEANKIASLNCWARTADPGVADDWYFTPVFA